MNYYHELLESYSKLKKRSLTLIAEGDEADEKKKAARQASLKNALPLAIAAAEQGKKLNYGDEPFVPTGIFNDIEIFKSSTGKTLLDDGRLSTLFDASGTSTYVEGDLLSKGKAWTKLASAFIDPDQEEGTETEEDNAAQAENNKTTEEEAAAEAIEANKKALNPFLEEMGIETEQVEGQEGQDGDETSEFNPDTLKEVFKKDGSFTRSVKSTIQKWIEDTTVAIEDKIESATNLRDLIYLTADLSRKIDNEEKLEQADINKVNDLLKKIALTKFGGHGEGFILNKDKVDFDEYSVLVFGRGAGKHVKKVLGWKEKIISTIEAVRAKWGEATHEKDTIDDFEVIQPPAKVTSDARGKADEAIMAGAGDIVSILSLADQIKITEDDVERKRLEERRSWAISRLQTHWDKATTKLTAQQLAENLRMGLESMEGIGIDTLASMGDEELTTALVDRLINSYPKSFCSRKLPSGECDRGEAMAFVETLASEEDGKRAFLTFLFLRAKAIRDVLGEEVSPSFSYTVGEISQTTKGKRIKKDVVYAVDSKNLEALKKHLQSKGVALTGLLQNRTIKSLLDSVGTDMEGMPVHETKPEDFPPGTFVDPENITPEEEQQEFTMLQVSLKAQPASTRISKGSYSPTTLKENMKDPHRKTVRRQLTKSEDNEHGVIGEEGNNEGLPTNTEIDTFYGSILGATTKERGADLKERMKEFSTKNPSLFRAVALELFTLAGTAAMPQLNVTNELDTGETSMESDRVFREKIQQGIGNKTLTFKYGSKTTKGQINIVDAEGVTIAYLKFTSGGRVEAITTPEYTRQQKENEKNKTGVAENKDSLMTDFLKAQATLIQELLATH